MTTIRNTLCMTLAAMATGAALSASLQVDDLRVEGQLEPQMVDTAIPRFGWRLLSDEKGAVQAAYHLQMWRVNPADGARTLVADTGRVEGSRSQWIEAGMATLRPRSDHVWRVRVWNGAGQPSDWSEEGRFSTGLLGESWPAPWMSDGQEVPMRTDPAARYLRQDFELDSAPRRARLFLSALGLADPWLNGRRVTEDLFLPGWPEYSRRALYRPRRSSGRGVGTAFKFLRFSLSGDYRGGRTA